MKKIKKYFGLCNYPYCLQRSAHTFDILKKDGSDKRSEKLCKKHYFQTINAISILKKVDLCFAQNEFNVSDEFEKIVK